MLELREERRIRARQSIMGLAVGDGFGDKLFFYTQASQSGGSKIALPRVLPPSQWDYTEDTLMALSIVETLFHNDGVDQDFLAKSFAEHFERSRGYGSAMYALLPRIQQGESWQEAAASMFQGQGSYGNGAAMRVAPLGAYFADDLPLVVEQARLSAEATHPHPDGIAGAIAIAVSSAYAWRLRVRAPIPRGADFLNLILPHVPSGRVAEGIAKAAALPPKTPVQDAVLALGNGSNVLAHDTVPFVLWCAARRLDSYEEALWLTAKGLGDMDTNCAMVGGIVATYTGNAGIPTSWVTHSERLPLWPFGGQL